MIDNNLKNILELLRRGDNATLQKIYIENRKSFIHFSKKFNVKECDAVDIYQDAIIILRENIISGKIKSLRSSISTYLFSIGKYKIYEAYRKSSKTVFDSDILINEKKNELDVNFYNEETTNQQKALVKYFSKLGERCKSILVLFYYQGYTLDEITEILNYSDKNVLKSQKSRCVKQLRSFINRYERI
jgi:RNA polymerase sigma factor (sigma-70 family)